MQREELLSHVTTRIMAVSRPHPLRVAVDGIDAAGKTTLADDLARCLAPRPVVRASLDSFHNPRAVRYRLGPDSPEGYYQDGFNLSALRGLLLDPLGPGGNRQIQTACFDFRADSPRLDPPISVPPNAILLLDGVFLHRPELARLWDFSIYLQVSFETALARALERDLELFGSAQAVIDRYTKRYFPAQQRYLLHCQPQHHASLVISNEDPQHPHILSFRSVL